MKKDYLTPIIAEHIMCPVSNVLFASGGPGEDFVGAPMHNAPGTRGK